MEPAHKALSDLFDALDRLGSASARAASDDQRTGVAEVAGHVAHVASLWEGPTTTPSDEPPPRPVAVAMAQALFAEPHSRRTLAVQSTASESLVIRADETLADALGLSSWELDELRNDVDRRVADVLARIRAMQWLWHRAGNPRNDPTPLHRMLFPGGGDVVPTRYLHKGCRLYCIARMERPPPPESLFLPWMPGNETWDARPDHAFDPRFLDDGLVRALSRSIGRDDDATRALLASVVCVIPEAEAKSFLARDRWRSEGWSDVTGLGMARPGASWIAESAPRDTFDVTEWMARTDQGGVAVQGARRAFDTAARQRVGLMLHSLYAELCARQLADAGLPASGQPVLFDIAPYIQRVLQPLVKWTARDDVRDHVASTLDITPETASAALKRIGAAWSDLARTSWGGVPSDERPHTIQGILAAHLARVQASLAQIRRMEPDPRADHHRMLLLFFAFHVSNAPLGRLWRPEGGRVPDPEDVPGAWFWPTWRRVLDAAVGGAELTEEVSLYDDD